jgi:dTMP kinase
MSARGKFVTLEGVDGAGKSTHVQFIRDALAAGGRRVIVTREPGGTELADRIRDTVLKERMEPIIGTLLIFAARADHVARVIAPALAAGSSVVCDRFTDSTIAYQGAGEGIARDLIDRLTQAAHGGLTPDRTFIFDVPYTVSTQRLQTSGKQLDRFEREDHAFVERVRGAYLAIARAEPARVRVIDASADIAQVRKQITENLKDL